MEAFWAITSVVGPPRRQVGPILGGLLLKCFFEWLLMLFWVGPGWQKHRFRVRGVSKITSSANKDFCLHFWRYFGIKMNPNLILSYLGSFIWPSWRYLHGYRFHVFFEGFQDPPKSEDRQKWKVLWGLQGPITKYKRLPEAVDLTGKQTCRPLQTIWQKTCDKRYQDYSLGSPLGAKVWKKARYTTGVCVSCFCSQPGPQRQALIRMALIRKAIVLLVPTCQTMSQGHIGIRRVQNCTAKMI